ncbi:MAG: DUF924 domain-containing protein [Deltaproteobacteria bacterium HGW-Deltaproteobacteria-14]|jgi:uncharacterized protein (DUF924 family)|nr:MAG: DUF924 domain-containing protein [Deltaproteobacteria bacterium HGW-Deltaproteobacteria-14]
MTTHDGDGWEAVLAFWFGALDAAGHADAAHAQRWWRKDEGFDRELGERFGALHRAVAAGEREAWLATPRGRLGYVIVLDQLSRNLFRDTAGMYANDARALAVAAEGLDRGDAATLAAAERRFLYMPFMHAETLADQERCVALFQAEVAAAPPGQEDSARRALDFAIQHRDIVARFGRFPHRNALVGRVLTAEELAFLEQPGSSF